MATAVETLQSQCSGLEGEEPDDRRADSAEALLIGHHSQTCAVWAGVRLRSSSVCTVDLEERGPTAGIAGRSLSGTAGRLAAPLRGRHRKCEDSNVRLNSLSWCCAASRRWDRRAALLAASGGCIHLYTYSRLEQKEFSSRL